MDKIRYTILKKGAGGEGRVHYNILFFCMIECVHYKMYDK